MQFLSGWCRNQFKGKNENKSLVQGILTNITKPSPSTSRVKDPALEWGTQNWDDELKEQFYIEYPDIDQTDPNFLPLVRAFKKRKFEELPEIERMGWIQKMKDNVAEQSTKLSEPTESHTRANE